MFLKETRRCRLSRGNCFYFINKLTSYRLILYANPLWFWQNVTLRDLLSNVKAKASYAKHEKNVWKKWWASSQLTVCDDGVAFPVWAGPPVCQECRGKAVEMIDDKPPLALSSLLTCTHNPTLFTANWTTLQIPSLRLWSTKLATDNCPELVPFMNVQNCHTGKVSLILQRLLNKPVRHATFETSLFLISFPFSWFDQACGWQFI